MALHLGGASAACGCLAGRQNRLRAAQKATTESETGGSVTVSDQFLIWMLLSTCVKVGFVSVSGEPE